MYLITIYLKSIINLLIFLVLSTFLLACEIDKPEGIFFAETHLPVIDGKEDAQWRNIPFRQTYYYYGQEAEDSMDFKPEYKLLCSRTHLFIHVSVYDQIKYTHPFPANKFDQHIWNPADYDRVSLSFDVDNNGEDDIAVAMNVGLDSLFTKQIYYPEINAVQLETENGYKMEFEIPLDYFKNESFIFNIVVTDHDKRFHKEGIDVYGRYESMYGAGGYFSFMSNK